jgi:hypothetical protein
MAGDGAEDGPIAGSLRALHERRACVRCGASYKEIDNLGAWRCAFHPGVLGSGVADYNAPAHTYSCCARSPCGASAHYVHGARVGCLPADHVALDALVHDDDELLQGLHEPPLVIDIDSAHMLLPPGIFTHGRGIGVITETNEYIIHRNELSARNYEREHCVAAGPGGGGANGASAGAPADDSSEFY